jgi:hypothetical protein
MAPQLTTNPTETNMRKKTEYYIFEDTEVRVNKFTQWAVVDGEGYICCMFYGPKAVLCAIAACKAFRDPNNTDTVTDHFAFEAPKELQIRPLR